MTVEYTKHANGRFAVEYAEYQKRYRETLRESDRVLLERIPVGARAVVDILDAGCSTGNLIYYGIRLYPCARWVGVDLMREAIEACANDPALAAARFIRQDIRETPYWQYDVVIFNAILCLLPDADVAEIFRIIPERIPVLIFDYAHPHNDLTVTEVTDWHPEGLTLRFRPYKRWLELTGRQLEFQPFQMPFEIVNERPDQTRTVESTEGRLSMRGALYQPQAHIFG